MNSEDREDISTGLYSRCSIGRHRWFWAAWASFHDLCEGKTFATGIASTAAEAEDQAKQALTTEEKCQQSAGYAADVKRHQSLRRAAKRKSNARAAKQVEYVYEDYWSDYDGSRNSSTYRIVKKTAKRIYVETKTVEWKDEQGQTYYEVRTITLDRAEFEKNGKAFGGRRGNRQFFYDRPYEERAEAHPSTPCFVTLELTPPVSKADVSRAYRRKAKLYHPDHGGDPEKFKIIQQAYEEAMALTAS